MARLAKPFLGGLSVSMAARRMAAAVGLAGALALGACSTVAVKSPFSQEQPSAPPPAPVTTPVIAPKPEPIRAAILLPLTGSRADLGQQMLNAAQLAVSEVGNDNFELLMRDTKGTPQGAVSAMRQALADGAKVVLGPVFSPEAMAARPVAQAAGIDMLTFSSDLNVAGANTHVLGFVPADQVSRVAGYAGSRGLRRFAVVAPRNEYGEAVVASLQASAGRQGAQITTVERYDAVQPDFTTVVQDLTRANPSAQAILFGDSVERAKAFVGAATTGGLDLAQGARLMGTGLWDTPTIGREASLVGAWFAAADPASRIPFETTYEKTFGKKPIRLATIAYDATALVATLARARGAAGLAHSELVNDNGFSGYDGVFRLRGNGVAERRLAVLEITQSGVRVVDPAQTSFDQPSF